MKIALLSVVHSKVSKTSIDCNIIPILLRIKDTERLSFVILTQQVHRGTRSPENSFYPLMARCVRLSCHVQINTDSLKAGIWTGKSNVLQQYKDKFQRITEKGIPKIFD